MFSRRSGGQDAEELEVEEEEEDVGNETVHRNTYNPQILPIWEDQNAPPEPEQVKSHRVNYSVLLTDDNAKLLSETTRVGWKGRINYSMREQMAMQNRLRATKDEIQRDTNRMLETVISSVIMLASNNELPLENYMYTELYLDNIKDPFGDHPPNISNFLHYLSHLKKEQNIEFEKSYHTEDQSSVVVMKIQNRNKLNRVPVLKVTMPTDETPKSPMCSRLKKKIDLQCPYTPESEQPTSSTRTDGEPEGEPEE